MTPVEVIALHGCSRVEKGRPCHICVGQAERHVRAVERAGMAVAAECACGQPVGSCPSCDRPRCWHCDPGLGKGRGPMKCNERHEPALPEETDRS